ncbi:MAG: plasmid mobilization relaxosome protein MobC [Firmicutes bacterium]|nr:plasmid mobilization relaxosome protein MobC [Bacillota bacterium]
MEENRKRKHIAKCRLNDEEFELFNHKVDKTKLSKDEFIRSAIFNSRIVEKPNIDFYNIKTELNRIGNNLNQLCRLANSGLAVDTNLIDQTVNEINSFTKKIGDEIFGNH